MEGSPCVCCLFGILPLYIRAEGAFWLGRGQLKLPLAPHTSPQNLRFPRVAREAENEYFKAREARHAILVLLNCNLLIIKKNKKNN